MDDGFDEDLATLEALERLSRPTATPAERKRKERRRKLLLADADLYNRIVAQYGRAVLDALIEGGWTARTFVRLSENPARACRPNELARH
jgi:hypothetical protein